MLKIYHNNQCSKSREALALLTAKGLAFDVVHYLATPIDKTQLSQLLQKLAYSPRQLLRENEAAYRELGLADLALTDDALLAAMLSHPKLIERPIIEWSDRAIVARPLSKLQDLL
jgi:arsenate reductase